MNLVLKNVGTERVANLVATFYVVVAILLSLSSAIHFGHATRSSGVAFFENPLKPSYFYFFTFAVALGLAALQRGVRVDRVGLSLIAFFLAYGVMHILWIPFMGPLDDVATRTLVLRINTVIMSICMIAIVSNVKNVSIIRFFCQLVIWSTCALNVIFVIVPELFPVRMSSVSGRAAGLYWDANQCATMLALSIPLICANVRLPLRLLNYVVVFVGVSFTFSRGGWVLWVLAVSLDLLLRPGFQIRSNSRIALNAAALFSMVLLAGALFSFMYQTIIESLKPYLTDDTLARMSGSDRGSGDERILLMKMGLEMFYSSPIFGGGFNVTRSWDYFVSVHNMFLLSLAEFGVVGFMLYGLYIYIISKIKGNFGLILAPLIVVLSFFTHSLFDFSYYSLLVILYWRVGGITLMSPSGPPILPGRGRAKRAAT